MHHCYVGVVALALLVCGCGGAADGIYMYQRSFIDGGAKCENTGAGKGEWKCIADAAEYKNLCQRIKGITEYGLIAVKGNSALDRFLLSQGTFKGVTGEWVSSSKSSWACKGVYTHAGQYEGTVYNNKTVEGWVRVFGVDGGKVLIHEMTSYPP